MVLNIFRDRSDVDVDVGQTYNNYTCLLPMTSRRSCRVVQKLFSKRTQKFGNEEKNHFCIPQFECGVSTNVRTC